MKRVLAAFFLLSTLLPFFAFAEERVNVLPPSAFYRSMIYVDLALFWMAIIVLVVVARLKLREIERAQATEEGVKNEDVPMLE